MICFRFTIFTLTVNNSYVQDADMNTPTKITDINDLLAIPIHELDAMSESQLKSLLDTSIFTQTRQPLLPEDKPGKQGNVHRLAMDYLGKTKLNATKLRSDLDALQRALK